MEAGVSGFPVIEDSALVGVVSRTDIVRRLVVEHEAAERTSDFYLDAQGFHEVPVESMQQVADRVGEQIEQLTVRDVMHHSLFTVSADQTLRAVAETLADHHIHRVLVTEQGQLIGVITAMDFVRLYASRRIASD